MKRNKAQQEKFERLIDIGVEEMPNEDEREFSDLIGSFAAMLEYATRTKKRAPNPENSRRWKLGQEWYEYLKANAPKALVYEPHRTQSYTHLGKVLGEISATEGDMIALSKWLNNGNPDWFTEKPTWASFVKWVVEWLAQARICYEPQEAGAADWLRDNQ